MKFAQIVLLAAVATVVDAAKRGRGGKKGKGKWNKKPVFKPHLHPKFHAAATKGKAVAGEYLVTFKSGGNFEQALKGLLRGQGKIKNVYKNAINGAIITNLKTSALKRLLKNKNVNLVEQNEIIQIDDNVIAGTAYEPLFTTSSVSPSGTQSADYAGINLWGLDRTDQDFSPLDDVYTWGPSGAGVDVYVLDTGIRTSHVEFEGRATCPVSYITGEECNNDLNGHGTHCAGTVGGANVGVAKDVNLIGVKVLSNSGGGTLDGVLDGIDYAVTQHAGSGRPSVISMSLGTSDVIPVFDAAIDSAMANGVHVVVAAGNENVDACGGSPGSSDAITVGASDRYDYRASFSNYGSCLTLFAPGVGIYSAGISSNTQLVAYSGTSMATPHVAGVVAQLLEQDPTATPFAVKAEIIALATADVVNNPVSTSPNLLLRGPEKLDTAAPTTSAPTQSPTTQSPTTPRPTDEPTKSPTNSPTANPTTAAPTTPSPTSSPTTKAPSASPTKRPTQSPTTAAPTIAQTKSPTNSPTASPSTAAPTTPSPPAPTEAPNPPSPSPTEPPKTCGTKSDKCRKHKDCCPGYKCKGRGRRRRCKKLRHRHHHSRD